MPTFLKVTVTAVLDPALTSLGIVFETHSTRKPASGNGWTVGAGRAANSVGPRSGGRPQSVATTHATGTTSEIRWLIFRVRVPRGTKLRRLPRNQTLRNRATAYEDTIAAMMSALAIRDRHVQPFTTKGLLGHPSRRQTIAAKCSLETACRRGFVNAISRRYGCGASSALRRLATTPAAASQGAGGMLPGDTSHPLPIKNLG